MTRINVIEPKLLLDQHLMAEIKEINQLAGQFLKSLNSKDGVSYRRIPKEYTLNTGHVYFFYDKGLFLKKRFDILVEEAKKRGFNITCSFLDIWNAYNLKPIYLKDWQSSSRDVKINLDRIFDKVKSKPSFYRYYGKKLTFAEYKGKF